MTVTQSYNDADGFLSNPSAFRESYMRGAIIWKDAAKTEPRDCQKFFLAPGVAENWSTLRDNLARIPQGVNVGFRITDMDAVPAGWAKVTLNDHLYPNWMDESVWTKYGKALDVFKVESKFGQPGGVTWVDIPYIWRPSNEPSITDADCATIGNGNVANGKDIYLTLQMRMIDLYVEKFGRAVVGNLGGPTWARKYLLPYAKSKGVRAFRQDSWMRFDWRGVGKDEGENRSSLYNESIAILGGRDSFDRLIPEQTGNGLTLRNGVIVDQGPKKMPCTVWTEMMGPSGEFSQLEATDYGNMGLPSPAPVTSHPNAQNRYEAWYSYIGAPFQPGDPDPPPGDGGDPAPGPVPVTVHIVGGLIIDLQTVPDEDWGDADGKEAFTFTSEHPAKVTILSNLGPPKFIRWEFPPGNPSGGDGPTDQEETFFRTDTRGTDITVRAVYEDEPIPDPDPTDPVEPPEFVTREEFDTYRTLMSGYLSALRGRIESLEEHNDSWADAMEGE